MGTNLAFKILGLRKCFSMNALRLALVLLQTFSFGPVFSPVSMLRIWTSRLMHCSLQFAQEQDPIDEKTLYWRSYKRRRPYRQLVGTAIILKNRRILYRITPIHQQYNKKKWRQLLPRNARPLSTGRLLRAATQRSVNHWYLSCGICTRARSAPTK